MNDIYYTCQRGTFTPVDNMAGLRLSLGSYYKQFSSPNQQSKPVVSAPFIDDSGLGKCLAFQCFTTDMSVKLSTIQFNMIYSNNIQQTLQFKTIQTCYTHNVDWREYTRSEKLVVVCIPEHTICGHNHNNNNNIIYLYSARINIIALRRFTQMYK